jgi:hypothetical protein
MRDARHLYSRRTILRTAAATTGAAALAGAGPRSSFGQGPSASSPIASPGPLQITSPNPTPDSAATVLVRDVTDFTLHGDFLWNGGSVTFRLHEGWVDGMPVYFVRTDTSDQAFAEEEGLVFVPVLAAALATDGGTGRMFLFENGAEGQLPVLSTAPGYDDFTPLYRVVRVTFAGDPVLVDAASDVDAAVADGRADAEETQIVVNYPSVRWPGGELPVDPLVERPLEGGPLLSAPDLEAMTVTFKLHQCYPASRYIVTDTSAVPMAPMMNIAGSPGTAGLAEAGAASTITVFGNGLTGPGAMGFQPGIFPVGPDDPAWSPLWDHVTAVWADPAAATLLATQAELDAQVDAGAIELFAGTPDTGGQGFIVNCPAPIVAPNDFELTG